MANEDPNLGPTSNRAGQSINQSRASLESQQFAPISSRASGLDAQRRTQDKLIKLQEGLLHTLALPIPIFVKLFQWHPHGENKPTMTPHN